MTGACHAPVDGRQDNKAEYWLTQTPTHLPSPAENPQI